MNIKFKGIAFEIEYFCKNWNILSLLNDVMHLCSIKGLISFFFTHWPNYWLLSPKATFVIERPLDGKYCIYKRQSYRSFNKSKVICTLCVEELHRKSCLNKKIGLESSCIKYNSVKIFIPIYHKKLIQTYTNIWLTVEAVKNNLCIHFRYACKFIIRVNMNKAHSDSDCYKWTCVCEVKPSLFVPSRNGLWVLHHFCRGRGHESSPKPGAFDYSYIRDRKYGLLEFIGFCQKAI